MKENYLDKKDKVFNDIKNLCLGGNYSEKKYIFMNRGMRMNRTYEIYPFKVEFLFMHTNNYIIVDKYTNKAAIVDPAWDLNKIINKIEELNVDLSSILLTHSHQDHINKVDMLVERYGVEVYMSMIESNYYGFQCSNLKTFKDGQVIQLGRTQITCFITPGHTVGGTCFLLSDDLISGDTLFIEGCGICDTIGGSPEQMYQSFQKIRSKIPLHIRVYPGHTYIKEPGVLLGTLIKNNIYFQFQTEEQFVEFRMRKIKRIY